MTIVRCDRLECSYYDNKGNCLSSEVEIIKEKCDTYRSKFAHWVSIVYFDDKIIGIYLDRDKALMKRDSIRGAVIVRHQTKD